MIRKAEAGDIPRVNELRKQVNDVHVQGRPDIFKPGFPPELRDHVEKYLSSESSVVYVEETDGEITGMIMVEYIAKPESTFFLARNFCHITELCVDQSHRRQGIAHRLIDYVKAEAKQRGLTRIELDVWTFNDAALFYEAEGFQTYRNFLEYEL